MKQNKHRSAVPLNFSICDEGQPAWNTIWVTTVASGTGCRSWSSAIVRHKWMLKRDNSAGRWREPNIHKTPPGSDHPFNSDPQIPRTLHEKRTEFKATNAENVKVFDSFGHIMLRNHMYWQESVQLHGFARRRPMTFTSGCDGWCDRNACFFVWNFEMAAFGDRLYLTGLMQTKVLYRSGLIDPEATRKKRIENDHWTKERDCRCRSG